MSFPPPSKIVCFFNRLTSSLVHLDRKRNESAKSEAMRELTQISSQMSSTLTRVRKQDVDDAKDSAAKLAHDRDEMNNNPRREEITKEIRVLEDKLKAISTAIETDTKVRDTLRMKQGEQQEIDMLEKQVQQEYDVLKEMLRDQSYAISEQGENCNVSREDPVSPVDVLANNIRSKLLNAQDDVERQSNAVNDIQKKLSEKQALLGNHVQRLQQLDLKKKRLLAADGGVQKIKSTIRAIIRYDQDTMDTDYINEDSSPSEILKVSIPSDSMSFAVIFVHFSLYCTIHEPNSISRSRSSTIQRH